MKTINKTPCLKVVIPFNGFYNTLLSEGFDMAFGYELEVLSQDYGVPDSDLPDPYNFNHNFSEAFEEMARVYLDKYCEEYGINVYEFEALVSPREYNFSTDRIFAYIPYKFLLTELKAHKNGFAEWLKDRMAPCSGFMPFYSNVLSEWPENRQEWDFNQWGLLLDYLARECPRVASGYGYENDVDNIEHDTYEALSSNGFYYEYLATEWHEKIDELREKYGGNE